MKVYVAMDIGCIECAEDSALLGIFLSRADALHACAVAEVKHGADDEKHSFEVFEGDAPAANEQSPT